MSDSDWLIWIDCEMTGLDVQEHVLLEIAVMLSSGDLKEVVEGPSFIIRQSAAKLDGMNDWCKRQFGWRSAEDFDADKLAAQSLRSTVTEKQAEEAILQFLRDNGVAEKKAVLAGNTVHMDKRFIDKYLPKLADYMHYRIIDVSTVKELCRRWKPEIFAKAPQKKATHRAMDDIKESIRELAFYQQHFLR